MHQDSEGPGRLAEVNWNIGDEARARWELTPEKFEMDRGAAIRELE